MRDRFHELVRDTLTYLKDPLCPRPSFLTNAENFTFFQAVNIKAPARAEQQEIVTPQPRFIPKEKTAIHRGIQNLARGNVGAFRFAAGEAICEAGHVQAHARQPSCKDEDADAANGQILNHDVYIQPKSLSARSSSSESAHSIPPAHSPIKRMLERIAPNMKLTDQIPDDSKAKRIANGWKEKIADAEVLLLACDSHAETLAFLKGLAKAIDQQLAKGKILMAERLEREKRWDLFLDKNAFRLIIASDGMQKLPELMRFASLPAKAQFFLNKMPLLILSPLAMYKSLEHKALLWKTLCQMLTK